MQKSRSRPRGSWKPVTWGIAGLVSVVALTLFSLYIPRARRPELTEDRHPTSLDAVVSVKDVAGANDSFSREGVFATPEQLSEPVVSTTAELLASQTLYRNLHTAIEAGTYERLDASAILLAADDILSKARVAEGIPELSESGAMVLSLTGAPEGISADIAVTPSRVRDPMLTMNIAFPELDTPAYLNGALRFQARCRISVYSKDGKVEGVTITSCYEPHYKEMRKQGFPFDKGTLVQGTSWCVRPNNPDVPPKMSAIGMKDGQLADWQVDPRIDGAIPTDDELAVFGGKLLSLYENLKQERK